MGTRFRIFESHLSYVLQFLCDFGLYGCGTLELEDAVERCAQTQEDETQTLNSSLESGPKVSFAPSSYFRESRLPLEVDAIAPHILNRQRLAARNWHHTLQIPAPPLPSEPLILSVRELWEDERSHRESLGLHPSPEIPIDPSESTRRKGGEWVAEARWWEEITRKIEKQRVAHPGKDYDQKPQDWERLVMTTFESVEAIWEKKFKTWKPAKKSETNVKDQAEQMARVEDDFWDGKMADERDAEANERVDVDISLLSESDVSQLEEADKIAQSVHEPLIHNHPKENDGDSDDEDDSPNLDELETGIDPAEGDIVREEMFVMWTLAIYPFKLIV